MSKKNSASDSKWEYVDLSEFEKKYKSGKGDTLIAFPVQPGVNFKNPFLLLIAIVVVSALLALASFSPFRLINPDIFSLSGDLVKDITIMYISVIATMLGLCVTAFIFLNDSLKNRAEKDRTLQATVNEIFERYSKRLTCIAIGSAISIISSAYLDIFGELTEAHINMDTMEFRIFIAASVLSIAFVLWIIVFSCNITNSNRLIYRQSRENMESLKDILIQMHNELEEGIPEKPKSCLSFDQVMNSYNLSMAYMLSDTYHRVARGGPDDGKWIKLKDYSASLQDKSGILDVFRKDKGKKDEKAPSGTGYTDFLRNMGYIETVISKICENNINESIVASDSMYESIKVGFKWLFTGKKGDKYNIDVRDEKRFLDFVKFSMITSDRFRSFGYNNALLEDRYDKVEAKFHKLPPFTESSRRSGSNSSDRKCVYAVSDGSFRFAESKGECIKAYKENMNRVIDQFFCIYEMLCLYKNALIHIKASGTEKEQAFLSESAITEPGILANVLKDFVISRLTSFVKINNVNLGNSIVRKGWFNHTVLSDSNFTCSDFEYARLEYTVMRNCDLSTSSLLNVDASDSDLSDSNLNYSNLTGIDLRNAILSRAQMADIMLRDRGVDSVDEGYKAGQNDSCVALTLISSLKPEEAATLDVDGFKTALHAWSAKKSEFRKLDESATNCGEEAVLGAIKELKNNLKNNPGSSLSPVSVVVNSIKGSFILKREAKVATPIIQKTLYDASRIETTENNADRVRKFGRIHFRTAILRDATVDNVTLSNVDFSHVDMRFASFRQSDLSSSIMYYVRAEGTDFSECNLRGTDIHKADFSDAVFRGGNFVHAVISCSDIHNASFCDATMLNCTIINTAKGSESFYRKIEDARVNKGRIIEGSMLLPEFFGDDPSYENLEMRKAAYAVHSDWTGVKANEMIVIGMDLDSSIFDHSSLKRAVLLDNALRWGSFIKADLGEAYMVYCCFYQTNLNEIKLANAYINHCEMTNCCMENANLIGAECTRVDFSNCDFSNSNLSNAHFHECIFSYSIMDNVNITNATFTNCILPADFVNKAKGIGDIQQFTNCYLEDRQPITKQWLDSNRKAR